MNRLDVTIQWEGPAGAVLPVYVAEAIARCTGVKVSVTRHGDSGCYGGGEFYRDVERNVTRSVEQRASMAAGAG